MTIRRLRQILTYLTVIAGTILIIQIIQYKRRNRDSENISNEIITLCKLPELPTDITVRHAAIDPADNTGYVDVILTLTGDQEALNTWLEKVDQWEKKRPAIIYDHKLRESQYSARIDFNAEAAITE